MDSKAAVTIFAYANILFTFEWIMPKVHIKNSYKISIDHIFLVAVVVLVFYYLISVKFKVPSDAHVRIFREYSNYTNARTVTHFNETKKIN